jgi:hypothetical protein
MFSHHWGPFGPPVTAAEGLTWLSQAWCLCCIPLAREPPSMSGVLHWESCTIRRLFVCTWGLYPVRGLTLFSRLCRERPCPKTRTSSGSKRRRWVTQPKRLQLITWPIIRRGKAIRWVSRPSRNLTPRLWDVKPQSVYSRFSPSTDNGN